MFFHMLLPLYVFTEMSKIKEKLLSDSISLRERSLRGLTNSDQKRSFSGEELTNEFNAAKYLFASWRVASLFPELPENKLILQYQCEGLAKSCFSFDQSLYQQFHTQICLFHPSIWTF